MADGRVPCDAPTCAGFDPSTQRCLAYPPDGAQAGAALLCSVCFMTAAAGDAVPVAAHAADVAAALVSGQRPCVVRRVCGRYGSRLAVCRNPATWVLRPPSDPAFTFEVAGAAAVGCAFAAAHVTRAGGRPSACSECFMRVRAAAMQAQQAYTAAQDSGGGVGGSGGASQAAAAAAGLGTGGQWTGYGCASGAAAYRAVGGRGDDDSDSNGSIAYGPVGGGGGAYRGGGAGYLEAPLSPPQRSRERADAGERRGEAGAAEGGHPPMPPRNRGLSPFVVAGAASAPPPARGVGGLRPPPPAADGGGLQVVVHRPPLAA